MSEVEFLLKLQLKKYRDLQHALPKNSNAWLASKVTADTTEAHLEFLHEIGGAVAGTEGDAFVLAKR